MVEEDKMNVQVLEDQVEEEVDGVLKDQQEQAILRQLVHHKVIQEELVEQFQEIEQEQEEVEQVLLEHQELLHNKEDQEEQVQQIQFQEVQ